MTIYEAYLNKKDDIMQKKNDARKLCERIKLVSSLASTDVCETVNNSENDAVLMRTDAGIEYTTAKAALKYPQYSYLVTSFGVLFGESEFDTIDVSLLDTSNVFNMKYVFNYSKAKEIKGLEYWDTSKVRFAYGMFRGCSNLEKVDLSSFDFTNCYGIDCFFDGCNNLEEIKGLECLGHTKATYLYQTFRDCRSLKKLDLSNWDVTNITEIGMMFLNCVNLEEIKFTGWDLKNIENLENVFENCCNLKNLNDCKDKNLYKSFLARDALKFY